MSNAVSGRETKQVLQVIAGLILLSLVIFHEVLNPSRLLLTTDDNIGALALWKRGLPRGFLGWWNDAALVGLPGMINLTWTNLLIWLLPLKFVTNWIHAIDLTIASVFFVLFLRQRRLVWPACIAGMLAAFWVGSNFTLTYAGHIYKFAALAFAAMFLWSAEKAVRTGKISWAVLAGGALGGIFLEQPDLALFIAMFLFPYFIFSLIRRHGLQWRAIMRMAAPVLLVSLSLAARPLLAGYSSSVKNIASMSQEDSAEKWNFVTQWSWPPEESIDFIAPGFMGWRSGEPSGPYWGRMGRSAEWKKTGQGFMNFKLESQYLGASAVALMMLALVLAWGKGSSSNPDRFEVRAWGIIALLALLLSFGKHFPLYWLFYKLPMVSSIRNPNKFLQVFQVAVAILAAHGLHGLLSGSLAGNKARKYAIVSAIIGAVMIFVALLTAASWSGAVGRLANAGWAQYAAAIVGGRMKALFYGGGMLVAFAAWLWMMPFAKFRRGMPWFVCVLLLVDVLYLSRHYIQTMSWDDVAGSDNEVAKVLKEDASRTFQRSALADQSGFYNHWLTYLFPYQGINTINVTQMPRMPEDYKAFMEAVGSNPLRYWELCGVGPVLAPAGIWAQLQRDPAVKERFDIRFAYSVATDNRRMKIVPGAQSTPGQHCILGYRDSLPRYALVPQWEIVSDEEALRRLSSRSHDAKTTALLASDPALDHLAESGDVVKGSVNIKHYSPGRVELQVSADKSCILRLADKWSPEWRITMDDRPVDLLRCDYLFQGLYVPPGLHWVKMRFAPPVATLWIQLAGMTACLAALVMLAADRRGKDNSDEHNPIC